MVCVFVFAHVAYVWMCACACACACACVCLCVCVFVCVCIPARMLLCILNGCVRRFIQSVLECEYELKVKTANVTNAGTYNRIKMQLFYMTTTGGLNEPHTFTKWINLKRDFRDPFKKNK